MCWKQLLVQTKDDVLTYNLSITYPDNAVSGSNRLEAQFSGKEIKLPLFSSEVSNPPLHIKTFLQFSDFHSLSVIICVGQMPPSSLTTQFRCTH